MAPEDAALAAMTALAAAAIGYAVAWLRVDLDLRPRSVAVRSALISAVFAGIWLSRPDGGAILILFAAFGPLVWIDSKRRLLPDPITLPLTAIGLMTAIAGGRGVDAVIGAALGYAVFRAASLIWLKARGVDALGHGDAKLLAAIGAFLGWAALPEVVFIAAVSGVATALIPRTGASRDEIAFGPSLAMGAALSWAVGPVFG